MREDQASFSPYTQVKSLEWDRRLDGNLARKRKLKFCPMYHSRRAILNELNRTFNFVSRMGIATMFLLLSLVNIALRTSISPAGIAEVERVIVTGSNIPTAEEVGPNPVDTYRPQTSRN